MEIHNDKRGRINYGETMSAQRMTPFEVESREDLVRFVRELADAAAAGNDIENDTLPHFLGAASSWTSDMDGYFTNKGEPIPGPSWKLFAMILEAATVYE